MAINDMVYDNGTPRALGVPRNATPSPTYLGASMRLEPTSTLFIYILYKWQESYHKNKNKSRVTGCSLPHSGEAQTWASSLQVIQLHLGHVDHNCVHARCRHGDFGHQQWHLLHG